MYEAVYKKFSQDPALKEFLIGTDVSPIIYVIDADPDADPDAVANNRFWGTVNNVGVNMLGQILQKVRDDLRQEKGRDRQFRFNTLLDQRG